MMYADEVFADCEDAIESLCAGCPDEGGWAVDVELREQLERLEEES